MNDSRKLKPGEQAAREFKERLAGCGICGESIVGPHISGPEATLGDLINFTFGHIALHGGKWAPLLAEPSKDKAGAA